MASLGAILLTVLCVNAMLFLGQVAVTELNPSGPVFYSCEDSMIGQFENNNCQSNNYVLNDTNPQNNLPSGGSTVNVGNGNVFTDTFSAITGWFAQSTGISYIYNLVAAPANFLKAIGVPSEFSFAIGVIWYGFTLFVIVAFFFGRDY